MKLQVQLRESDPFGALLYGARCKRGKPNGKPLPMRKAAAMLETTEVTYGKWETGKPPALTRDLLKLLVEFTGKDALTVFYAWCAREDSNPQPGGYQFAA